MNTPQTETENPNAMPASYDPFAEKRTIPSGWDLSELFSDEKSEN